MKKRNLYLVNNRLALHLNKLNDPQMSLSTKFMKKKPFLYLLVINYKNIITTSLIVFSLISKV